jgi:hypothetical protein
MPPRKQKNLFSTLLPSWVPENVFNEYLKMRKSINKPLSTDYAIELAINKLDELRNQGQDVTEVMNQSILNSWQGLFPVRDDFKKKSGMDNAIDVMTKFVEERENEQFTAEAVKSLNAGVRKRDTFS